MINYAYSQRNQYNSTPIRTFLCGIVFLDLTAFFFLSFMNICFDTIVSDPPIWLLFILFMVMALDLFAQLYFNRRITPNFVRDLVIMIFLILSWAIEHSFVLFMSALIFLRFPEIVRFNEIMQQKLRSYDKLFKLYTALKIAYMFVVVGHVFGCIFYAIDNSLIKAEYYGKIADNPTLYYQGTLLCYSPIYSLTELDRYIYAMYYIVSLLATVAYGDIIPKNPFENAYVCILLVLSTISISFIIEQLLIVLSDNWDTIYQILKKMKYFDSMLAKSRGVSTTSRLRLVNFVIHSLKHEAKNDPNINRLTPSLQFRLMSQSIGMKKKTHSFGTDQGINKIVNLRVMQEYSFPVFLVDYLLLKLELKYYPNKYLIVDNQNPYEQTSIFISLSGQLKIGYGPNFLLRKSLKYKNRLFCWRQFLLDNKSVHPHFRIQTRVLSQLYTVGVETLRTMIKDERQKSISDDNFNQLLETYHIGRAKELELMQEESLFINQSTQSMNLILTEQNQQQETSEVSTHIIRCWGCGTRSHFPINCPNLHYKVNIRDVLAHDGRKTGRKPSYQRNLILSKKIKATYKQVSQLQKSKAFLKQLLMRKNEQVKNLKNLLAGTTTKMFERYENYETYFHEYNFRVLNNEPA